MAGPPIKLEAGKWRLEDQSSRSASATWSYRPAWATKDPGERKKTEGRKGSERGFLVFFYFLQDLTM